MKKILHTCLVCLLFLCLLAGCSPTTKEKYVITFDSDGGTKVESIEVAKGETLKLPDPPTKEGYVFKYWVDKNENSVYNDALLGEDTTLKAIWESAVTDTITITFDSSGGTKVSDITIKKGETLILPTSPTKERYIFRVWVDKNETPIYNDALLAEDTILKAVWDEAIRITFDSNGGTKVDDVLVVKGQTLQLPNPPTRDGYAFRTWVDQNEMPIYNDALLAEDTNLVAVWDKN